MATLFSGDDVLEITHDGKFVAVRDYAMDKQGKLVYLQAIGSRIVLDGIAAALFTSGKNNREIVTCDVFAKKVKAVPGVAGVGRLVKVQRDVRIADYAVGSMKKARVKLPRADSYGMTIYSELMHWDYNYRHVSQPAASDKSDLSSEEKQTLDRAMSRFIMRADPGVSEEVLARRWMGFLVKRHRDGLHPEWAYPMWRYCIDEGICVKEYESVLSRFWLWEPEQNKMRNVVRDLGLAGKLPMPSEILSLMEPESAFAMVAD